jgi:SSS family solute:Na+ symporter
VAVVAVTYVLSLFQRPSVFTLGVWCFSGYTGLFPLVFACLYWKRLTAMGAYAGILAMAGTWIWLFQESGYGADEAYTYQLGLFGSELAMMPVLPITLIATVAMVLVSLITSPPDAATLRRFFPKQHGSDAAD